MTESREAVTSRPVPFQFSAPEWAGLAKLAEEAAEVVQVCMKIVGTGGTMVFKDGQTVDRERIVEEIGDLKAAIEFFQFHALTEHENVRITQRRIAKRRLFEEWRENERD